MCVDMDLHLALAPWRFISHACCMLMCRLRFLHELKEPLSIPEGWVAVVMEKAMGSKGLHTAMSVLQPKA